MAGLRLRKEKVVAQRTTAELDAMAAAGALVAAALTAVREAAVPGVSTKELDAIAEAVIRDGGGIPSFLGYHGFPASICSSVNDRVVHGIPSATETLASGDLVSIDCGAILDGWHGDSAITFGVGPLIPVDEALSAATRESMEAGIAAMVPGNRLTDVSHAIEKGTRAAEARYQRGFGIVDGYGGHGIGRQMHMDPFLPNEGAPGRGPRLAPVPCWRSSPCSRSAPRRPRCSTTSGRSSPPTAPARHTGSTPWRSPRTGPASSRCPRTEPNRSRRRVPDGGWGWTIRKPR